jgi:hypothetical protein
MENKINESLRNAFVSLKAVEEEQRRLKSELHKAISQSLEETLFPSGVEVIGPNTVAVSSLAIAQNPRISFSQADYDNRIQVALIVDEIVGQDMGASEIHHFINLLLSQRKIKQKRSTIWLNKPILGTLEMLRNSFESEGEVEVGA